MNGAEFPALLQTFFTDYLRRQRQVSPHTVAAYRITFRLLLRFAAARLGRCPSRLVLADLDAAFLCEFLDYLQTKRENSPRTRNARLATLHAFFRYVAFAEPAHVLHCQRVLAIPSQRFERGLVQFLNDQEVDALVRAPNPSTWLGRRDRALLLVAVQTGLRVSEIIALCRKDIELGTGAHLRCVGKGRKLRAIPLRRDVVAHLATWLNERPSAVDAPVFASRRGAAMSPDAVERLVARHAAAAARHCPSLAGKHVTPHTLRHTTAMQLLQRGVDRSVIALWLGHESMETTQIYLHADLALKEKALARTSETGLPLGRYHPADALLSFLEGL
jgi:site-specific recombinase XerD